MPVSAGVDGDWNVRLQRLPGGVDIAGPEERGVALHAGVTVAMEREGRWLGRSICGPSQYMRLRARREGISSGSPSSGHQPSTPMREIFAVRVPIAARLGSSSKRASRTDRAPCRGVVSVQNHDVQHDAEMFACNSSSICWGSGKTARFHVKRAVVSVPAGRAKAGAEIDQCVAGQFLLAERFRFGEDLLAAGERAVRLLIARGSTAAATRDGR